MRTLKITLTLCIIALFSSSCSSDSSTENLPSELVPPSTSENSIAPLSQELTPPSIN